MSYHGCLDDSVFLELCPKNCGPFKTTKIKAHELCIFRENVFQNMIILCEVPSCSAKDNVANDIGEVYNEDLHNGY